MSPKISVLLPAYNSETTIEAALGSIQKQTIDDLQIIVIDDGSTDTTSEILSRMAGDDPRILLRSRANKGLIKTLNEAISLAQGEWSARMDADDIAEPERLEKQLRYAEQTGATVLGSYHRCFGDSEALFEPSAEHADIVHKMHCWTNSFSHPSLLVKTRLLKAFPYSEEAQHAEDFALWLRLAREAKRDKTIVFGNVSEVLLQYRTHAQQVSQRFEKVQRETVKQQVLAAISDLDDSFKEGELELHFELWATDRIKNLSKAEWEQYGQFLSRLAKRLSREYGASDAVFRYWRRLLKKCPASVRKQASLPDLGVMGASLPARVRLRLGI